MSELIHLLPPVPRWFKANLHTHTNISDGVLTPQQAKDLYKGKGYSILAITDHNLMVDHSELSDEDFLMLTGGEFNINTETYLPSKGRHGKTYHLNMIAKDPHNVWQPFPMVRIREASVPYVAKSRPEAMVREYSVEAVNAIIARANEKGFLVTYNHPVWSMQEYPDYAGLEGLWAMEICNYGSVMEGHPEHNGGIYQTMLRLGKRICPVAADDMHSPDHAFAGAWCMVGAEKLEYDAVIRALERGDFYASTGPEIHSLTMEGPMVRITCSDARSVALEVNGRRCKIAFPERGDGLLRQAEFDLTEWLSYEKENPDAFFRLTVNGPYGHYAATRGYWLND